MKCCEKPKYCMNCGREPGLYWPDGSWYCMNCGHEYSPPRYGEPTDDELREMLALFEDPNQITEKGD